MQQCLTVERELIGVYTVINERKLKLIVSYNS